MATSFIKTLTIMAMIINIGHSQTAYNHKQTKNNKIIINLQNNFGYTIVDVAQAMEIPEFSDITNEGLVSLAGLTTRLVSLLSDWAWAFSIAEVTLSIVCCTDSLKATVTVFLFVSVVLISYCLPDFPML